jgi:polyhydroxyalkanoate synthase subunit PhaC
MWWLPIADEMDRTASLARRAGLHALGALARGLHGKAPIPFIGGPALPYEVVSEGPLARLLRYDADVERDSKVPILLISSLINRYYVLDLLPELSVVSKLCERGFDVWVLDWKATGDLGPRLGFADYVDGAIASAAADAARSSGVPSVTVLGYCMGGTLAAMFAAHRPELVKALCLLGTPIDFHGSGMLADWTQHSRFDADLMMEVFGNMPPQLMQSGFKLLNPADAWFKQLHLMLDGADEARVRQFVALEAWLDDNISFPGGVYREYIKQLYQDNALVRGAFRLGGTVVDLAKISAPLLNVIALRDHICAPPSSRALMPLVASADKQVLEFDAGHIGISTSRRAHAELWPKIIDWMLARS